MKIRGYYLLIFLLFLALIPNHSRCVSSFPFPKPITTKQGIFASMMPQQVPYPQSGNKPFVRLSRKEDAYFQPYESSSQFVSFIRSDLNLIIRLYYTNVKDIKMMKCLQNSVLDLHPILKEERTQTFPIFQTLFLA